MKSSSATVMTEVVGSSGVGVVAVGSSSGVELDPIPFFSLSKTFLSPRREPSALRKTETTTVMSSSMLSFMLMAFKYVVRVNVVVSGCC